jgi:unsaturated rhamnogalacturonyl hydrolase
MTPISVMLARITFVCLVTAAATGPARADGVVVTVTNPSEARRASETVALGLAEIRRLGPALEPRKLVVRDAAKAEVLSQLVDVDGDETPDELVFQTDLGAREGKRFSIEPGERKTPARDDFRVYGRFVRERHDDFAWENDRIAHRIYGPDLETWRKEPLTSSGIDVWAKRVRKLVINDWYQSEDYHRDRGEGADLYSVGKSRGCGGLGIWSGGKLVVSRNFVRSRVLTNGPIRLVFELDYAPWDMPGGGAKVSETKRITLDAGHNFDRVESRFAVDGPASPFAVGIGIAAHKGGTVEADKRGSWMRTWEPLSPGNGNLGCAVLLPAGSKGAYQKSELDHLVVTEARPGAVLAYQIGAGWDKSGDGAASDAATWKATVEARARMVGAPVRVSLAAAPGTAEAKASPRAWAARMAEAVMTRTPKLTEKWAYDAGLVLSGFEALWRATGDRKYFDFVKATVDRFIDGDGAVAVTIKGYELEKFNLDEINMGKVLFALHAEAPESDKPRYRKALALLRSQLAKQPRTADGGFWHKQIYPHQMWLDGVFMASPFMAKFGNVFGEPALLAEAAKQVQLAEKHLRDPKSGLLYHGWDEQKTQGWANPKTGASPQFWGRSIGWYAMAVVDVLAELPKDHPDRAAVLAVLRRTATAILSVQDRTTGVWWQVLDAGGRAGNYREASASAMFVYALSKGVAAGWLDAKTFGPAAALGWAGVLNQFVADDKNGLTSLRNVCKVAGLGGTPYRDGSYEYYVGTEVVSDDPKGVGAFLLAGVARG